MKTPQEALARMRALVGTGEYLIGDGQTAPRWDEHGKAIPGWRTDCIGAVLAAYDTPRHRPGFNVGPWSTCAHDVNTDAAIEDALHKQELFSLVEYHGCLPPFTAWAAQAYSFPTVPGPVQPGDLVIYHTDRPNGVRWGHVGMVAQVQRRDGGFWVLQSHGPNGAKMVVQTDDSIWRHHTAQHPHNPSMYLRVKTP